MRFTEQRKLYSGGKAAITIENVMYDYLGELYAQKLFQQEGKTKCRENDK